LLTKYSQLNDYFCYKLASVAELKDMTALEKEKNDLVVFSIMLLISRLMPSNFTVEGEESAPTKGGNRSR
jgi:hypothetical protein